MPGLVEGDDDWLYVVKFRGAGQGPLALVAELIGGEVVRQIGLPVPEIVYIDVDPVLARAEPDPEIQELIEASPGINLAYDFLPGALPFTAAAQIDPEFAAAVVWLDALVMNVDRTPRNPNLLCWHGRVWLIDHGAALYRQHASDDLSGDAERAFPSINDHVLLTHASSITQAHEKLSPRVDITITDSLPRLWLGDRDPATYRDFLQRRLEHGGFAAEAEEARHAA